MPTTPPQASAPGRVRELDAVRGIAALVVVLGHLAIVLPAVDGARRATAGPALDVLLYSPVDVVIAGGPAVVVFFVLSGFVLTLSYEGARQTYAGYLVRRVCRLWLPYVAAVAAGMVLATVLGGAVVPGASGWLDARWTDPVGAKAVLEHLALIGPMPSRDEYVPVIWSLVHEMRISIVLPAILAAMTVVGWRASVLATALLAYVGLELGFHVSDELLTLQYVVCFAVGASLARHRESLRRAAAALAPGRRVALLTLALLLGTAQAWLVPGWLPGPLAHIQASLATQIILQTAAAAIVVVLVQQPGRARSLLIARIPQHLGRISYSLYLVHTLVLVAAVRAFGLGIPALVLPAVLVASLALADLGQRWVERPAQRLGRRTAAAIEARAPGAGLAVLDPR